jgi:GT2 family glycosyltransferase
MSATVDVNILATNERRFLPRCIAAVQAQTWPAIRITVIDNASDDGTAEWLRKTHPEVALIRNERNLFYCESHNLAIARGDGEYVMPLNADVFLDPPFIERLVRALEERPDAGQAQGRLYQIAGVEVQDPPRRHIDTVGILVTRARRNFDRGQEEPDIGQYDYPEEIFGADGSAPLYRRAMLEEVAPDGEVFPAEFRIYREVVDLSWRAQALGWKALYVPEATGFHVRGFSPRTRSQMKPRFRRYSYLNRWATLIRNLSLREALPDIGPLLAFELAMTGHILLRERHLVRCWPLLIRRLPRLLRQRWRNLSRRRVPAAELRRHFI